ncbi:hypothetical protein C8R46DRAFT_447996 [Mycena filopes]|nr:hypothetical protein C8R46DRAFT_447996 [Mycena filopes]
MGLHLRRPPRGQMYPPLREPILITYSQNKKILDQIRSQNIHFIIEGGRNPVGADDLKRLCTCEGMVNDALVNYIVDMCHLKPLAFSDAVKIPPPTTESVSQDLVTSTFLWPKLQDASNAARAGDEESFRKQYEHIACWYSDIDFKNIRKVFIPIHQKAAHHWLLVKIHLVKSLIYIYDSWLPNQKNHARRLAESDNGMLADYAEIVHAVEYWWEMLTVRDGLPFPDWSKWLKAPSLQAIPHQLNGVDCGLFIIYFILYLQRWTTLHSPQIPAHLRFTGAGENMDYRRVLLFKLILQVGSPIAASSQRLASPASPPIIVDDPTGPLASPIVLVPRTVKAAPESDDFESDIEITSAFIEEVAEDEDMPESILAIEEEESLQNPNGKHTASRQDMVAPEQDVMMTPPSTSPLPTLTPTPPRLRRSTRKQKFK